MSDTSRTVLLLVGSTRLHGVSARYAGELARALESQGAQVWRWDAAAHDAADCIGCEGCRPVACQPPIPPSSSLRQSERYCIIEDDMQGLYPLIDAADEIHIVCPVYFAGPPGQFKSVLDRLQPYWERRIGPAALPRDASECKRPATLHVIGAGGDPYGFAPLEAIVRSALGSAGFRLEVVEDCIGWGQPAAESAKTTFAAQSGKGA